MQSYLFIFQEWRYISNASQWSSPLISTHGSAMAIEGLMTFINQVKLHSIQNHKTCQTTKNVLIIDDLCNLRKTVVLWILYQTHSSAMFILWIITLFHKIFNNKLFFGRLDEILFIYDIWTHSFCNQNAITNFVRDHKKWIYAWFWNFIIWSNDTCQN